ncbi:unnamed protein product [Urochloa humidicola]
MFNMVRRSFLAAQTHPLISHLNHGVHCHGRGGGSAVTGANSIYLTMSRSWSDWSDYEDWADSRMPFAVKPDNNTEKMETRSHCGECGRPNRQKRHLYQLVDDWREGFSVHKLHLNDKRNMGTRSVSNKYPCLPTSPVRIAFSGIGAGAQFVAMGSKIVACLEGQDGVTVIYDTNTEGLGIVRQSPDALHYHWEKAVATGDSLYAFVSKPTWTCSNDLGSANSDSIVHCNPAEMFCLEEVIQHPEEAFYLDDSYIDDNRVGKKCTWRTDPSLVPFYLCHGGTIRCYAVHPGSNRFYVSVTPAKHNGSTPSYDGDDIPDLTKAEEKVAGSKAGTYTYHTKTREWTHLGTWMLPFTGQGYYDTELDAWVGLQMGCHDNHCNIGSCDIPSRAWGSPEPPSWKLCGKDFTLVKTTLARDNTNVLVGMGGGRFCLVQSIPRNGFSDSWGDGNRFELHVTTFRTRYGKNGELTITDRRLVSSYILSRYAEYENFSIHAFWM